MKSTTVVQLLLVLAIAGTIFSLVQGCANDAEVERELEERRERIETLETEKDSIEALRREAADSLVVWKEKTENSDAARRAAERRTAVAYAALKRLPTYENLTHDALALRADSLYRALADG